MDIDCSPHNLSFKQQSCMCTVATRCNCSRQTLAKACNVNLEALEDFQLVTQLTIDGEELLQPQWVARVQSGLPPCRASAASLAITDRIRGQMVLQGIWKDESVPVLMWLHIKDVANTKEGLPKTQVALQSYD